MKNHTSCPIAFTRLSPILTLLMCFLCASSLRADVPMPGPGETNIVLESWSFEKTTNGPWASDDGYSPLSFTNLSTSNLGQGTALVLDSTNAAWLRYNSNEADGHTNITVSQGTIMMWFASTSWASTNEPSGTGPGNWARLLEIGEYTTNASYGWFSLYLDPAGTHVYFSSQTNNGGQNTYFSAPVDFKTNRWHHLAVTYGSTNSSFYLDGVLVTNAPPIAYWPGPSVLTNGFTIGSDTTGLLQAHGMFDDVATYGYPLDAQAVAGEFFAGEIYFLLNPMNAANLTQAPSEPVTTPTFQAITGSGFLTPIATNATCVTSSNVWLTNVSAAYANNGTMNLTFTIAGGSNGCVYDVFATPALQYPLTNGQWYWMGQGPHCVTYTITNLPNYSAMFILGTPQDSDGDGLTDAYELLVSHTDPNNPDSLGVGMSDGWQVAYGYLGGDPYSDPFNNGWTLLDEFLNGLDPTVYNQPLAPQGLTANFVNSTATVTWNPSGGTVSGYILEKCDPTVYPRQTNSFTLSATTNQFLDAGQDVSDDNLEEGPPVYRIQALYGTHASAWSSWVPLYTPDPISPIGSGYLVHGSQGQIYVAIPAPPQNATSVRIVFANAFPDQSWVVPISSFTNNCYLLPAASLPPYVESGNWFVELRDSATNWLGTVKLEYAWGAYGPFYDGRQQLQQNLSFLLRAAGATSPFEFSIDLTTVFYCPTDHVATSFVDLFYDDPPNVTPVLDPFSPFRNNYFLRNFAFSTNDLNSTGTLDTVADYTSGIGPALPFNPIYNFPIPTNAAPIDPILSPSDFPWTFFQPHYTNNSGFLSQADINYSGSDFTLPTSGVNLFGLQFQSVQMAYRTNDTLYTQLLSRPVTVPDSWNIFYPSTVSPAMLTTNYYFGVPFIDPLPGDGVFSLTNSTPALVAGVGQPYQLAGYAKQAILNGDPSKFGFLGQYFAGAYTIDTNGVATTNQTGILSEYGTFFPTQPGPAALITMTNWGVNERGTAIVNVVSLCLDANHDGTMDTTLSGPDTTSFLKPFRFWINNDCDWNSGGYNPAGQDVFPSLVLTPDYVNFSISSWRDLEDFARLWVCGMPPLWASNGYQVTLSWTNVNSGNPSVKLFQAVEPDGGTGYLTDTNIAAIQTGLPLIYNTNNFCFTFATVTNGSVFTFPNDFFTNNSIRHFLFEGANAGSGELILTVNRNGQTIAQTGAWFDLHDVREFFEEAYATNVTSGKPPSTLVSGFSIIRRANPFPDEAKHVIVFVHGINNTPWDWESTSATIFKRLYWAGYHGRFASFRWPCAYLPPNTANPFDFNLGEFYAFKSGTALRNYLNYLTNRSDLTSYSLNLYAHSQGVVVASEALLEGAPFVNFILSQGAFPAHCYDTNTPFLQKLLDAETNSPNAHQTPFYTTNGGYHGYCLSIQGNLVDFDNTNDFALATGTTLGLQTNWEQDQAAEKPEAFLGGPSYIYYPATFSTVAYYTFGSSYNVTDLQEIKSMVARSRTKAVGAQAGLHGAIGSSVDLFGTFGFGNTRPEHSAQFTRPVQQCLPYYQQTLTSFQILP